MINWMYYPTNRTPDDISKKVIEAFRIIAGNVDSAKYQYESNHVLSEVSPLLAKEGFFTEKSKKASDKIHVPVSYGLNGKVLVAFDADAYKKEAGYVIEVEAGRAVTNYQFLKDFYEACMMNDVNYCCIAVRNTYRSSDDFEKVKRFFDAMYSSNRIAVPLDGLLIIGY